jgi:hypothetical protein
LRPSSKSLDSIGFDVSQMATAKIAITEYMEALQLIVDLKKRGEDDEAFSIFSEDRGYYAWRRYDPFIQSAKEFLDDLELNNQTSYRTSINTILIIQVIFILISIPVLILAYRKIVKDDVFRVRLFKHLVKAIIIFFLIMARM